MRNYVRFLSSGFSSMKISLENLAKDPKFNSRPRNLFAYFKNCSDLLSKMAALWLK